MAIFVSKITIFTSKMVIFWKKLFDKSSVPPFWSYVPPFGKYPLFREKVICDPFLKFSKNARTPIKIGGGEQTMAQGHHIHRVDISWQG